MMINFKKVAGVAAVALVGSAVSASAALLDFTADSTYTTKTGALASGTFHGVGWTLVANPGYKLTYGEPGPGPTGVLTGDNDGVGATKYVSDDEITYPAEFLTLTFEKSVKLTGFYFLDLYEERFTPEAEIALVSVGSPPSSPADATFVGYEKAIPGGPYDGLSLPGYGAFGGVELLGTTFSFAAGRSNDAIAKPDYALAALDATVPLPAGVLLLGTALGGLGLARRKRS